MASGSSEKARVQLGTSLMVTKALSILSAPRRLRSAERKKVKYLLSLKDNALLDVVSRCKVVR